jgi:hypothetical protein
MNAVKPYRPSGSQDLAFALLAEPHHGGFGRATVSSGTRKEAHHVRLEVRA